MPNLPDVHPNSPAGGSGAGFTKSSKPLGLNPFIDVTDFTRGPVGLNPFRSALAADAQPALAPATGTAGTPVAGGAVPAAAPAKKEEEKPQIDNAIESLDLADTAKKAAYELKKAKPAVVFTSGRRDKDEQASAMADNIVKDGRDWIKNTYAKSAARDACQKWIDENKDKTKKDEITEGLKGVLDGLTDAQLNGLSKHLSGQAFDVQPVTPDKDDIKGAIQKLKGITKFLEKEGNLTRWHAEF